MPAETKPQVLHRYTFQPEPFNLAERMYGIPDHPNYDAQKGSCLAIGVRLFTKGTLEFDEAIAKFVERFDEERREDIAERFKAQDYFTRETSFRAWRWVNTDGITSIADGMPYQGILTDMRWLAILYLDTSEMTVLPFGDPNTGPHRTLFYDAIGAKGTSVRCHYTGTLKDAIAEFHQKNTIKFEIARLAANVNEMLQLINRPANLPRDRRIHGLITEKDVPFERVIEVISQDPNLYSAPALEN